MRANHSDHRLYPTYSNDYPSNTDRKDKDAISVSSLNLEPNSGLHYLSPNTNVVPNHRRISSKRLSKTIINQNNSNGNGVIINGSLFDAHLFQPSNSSYVIEYNDSPQNLNRFIQDHNTTVKSSQLDLHLFKLSFVISLSEWHVDKEVLLDYCPRKDDNNEDITNEITYYKRFCFPELNSKQKNGGTLNPDQSTFVFTRTLANGHVEYGYCRRVTYDSNQITKYPIVICIVSSYSYFKLYDAILNELTTAYLSNEAKCSLLMQSFYSKSLPIPTSNSSGIACKLDDRRVFFYVCPSDDRLNHDYFSTLLSCLSPSYIVHLLESMLRSKKILCFSNSISRLTKCCLALSLLTYPFIWPYPFVSVMPSSWLHDLVDSPCPYIYGCLYETRDQISPTIEKDSLRVDLDSNTIDTGIEDGFILPLDLRQTLQSSLEYLTRFRLAKSNSLLINIAVSEAFLHVFTELFRRLPDYFKRDEVLLKPTDNERNPSIGSTSLQSYDSGIDLQSGVSHDIQPEPTKKVFRREENPLGYDFRSDEFLISQPSPSYVTFLNDFIRGMIFLKFLDDYQRTDGSSTQSFTLFSQRLNERRRMTNDDLSINPVLRFRQTFDLLEKQIKQATPQTNPTFSKFVKKFFE